jgi:hypothetical protein
MGLSMTRLGDSRRFSDPIQRANRVSPDEIVMDLPPAPEDRARRALNILVALVGLVIAAPVMP